MGEDLSSKNLVTRTISNIWNVLLGRRPESYRIPEVGSALIEEVDHALFERKLEKAIISGVVLDKWAERDLHFECIASAVLSSIYSVCRLSDLAEARIIKSKKLIQPNCNDCKAQYLKRLGTFYMFKQKPEAATRIYTQAIDLFMTDGNTIEAAKSMLNRGVARAITRNFILGLHDEEQALQLLGDNFSIHIIAASVNRVAMFVELGRVNDALQSIEETQEILKGCADLERPKLLLRWIRALLLEIQNDTKKAGEMIDRIEGRMKRLDMKPELKALYADRARIASRPSTVQRIARKAYDMEDLPRIKKIIQTAMENPTRDNLVIWRSSLNAYIPPFPATV